MNATSLRLVPTRASRATRRSSQMAYGVVAAALIATTLTLLIGSDAEWWPAVAFALAPDVAVLYGIAPGLAHGQLHPRAVRLHNALHRFWGPLALDPRQRRSRTAARLARRWARLGIPCRVRPRDRATPARTRRLPARQPHMSVMRPTRLSRHRASSYGMCGC